MANTSTRRPRLLALGPAADSSSYCRVLHGIFRYLSEDWEIDHFGINYRGEPFDFNAGWHVHPNPSIGDRYGVSQVPGLVSRLEPDVIFLFNCFTVLPRYAGLIERLECLRRGRPRIVAYSPLMAEPLDERRVTGLSYLDRLVAFSPGVQRYFESCLKEGMSGRRPRFAAIPHGIDGDVFHLLPGGRNAAKRKVFGECLPEESFVVLNANRNGPRKRIEITIEGFARFAQGKPPGVRLHLHMGEHVDGRTIRDLVGKHGIEDRVHLACTVPGGHPEIPDDELNLLYNACDVGLNTASAEGWGMVSFEHAASGAPQIVPGHGVCREVWEGYGEVLDLVAPPCRVDSPILKEGIVSAEGVAAALERLYGDPGYRARMGERALANATRAEYQWKGIAKAWGSLLNEIRLE